MGHYRSERKNPAQSGTLRKRNRRIGVFARRNRLKTRSNVMYEKIDSFDDEPSLVLKLYAACSSLMGVPLIILNWTSLPVGVIWLCISGYWKLAIWGLLAWFFGGKLLGILTIPSSLLNRVAVRVVDRHRGGGHPPTPATPPCVRVRTRRFELVALALID